MSKTELLVRMYGDVRTVNATLTAKLREVEGRAWQSELKLNEEIADLSRQLNASEERSLRLAEEVRGVQFKGTPGGYEQVVIDRDALMKERVRAIKRFDDVVGDKNELIAQVANLRRDLEEFSNTNIDLRATIADLENELNDYQDTVTQAKCDVALLSEQLAEVTRRIREEVARRREGADDAMTGIFLRELYGYLLNAEGS